MKSEEINIDRELDRLKGHGPILVKDSFTEDILIKLPSLRRSSGKRNLHIAVFMIFILLNFASLFSVFSNTEDDTDSRISHIRTLVEVFSLDR